MPPTGPPPTGPEVDTTRLKGYPAEERDRSRNIWFSPRLQRTQPASQSIVPMLSPRQRDTAPRRPADLQGSRTRDANA